MEKPFEFQVGDICEFGGVEGVVKEIRNSNRHDYPVVWESKCQRFHTLFTLDGRYSNYHTKPVLNFISRPKKKVKKNIEIVTWVVIDRNAQVVGTYPVEQVCLFPGQCQIKSIAATEIEVEE